MSDMKMYDILGKFKNLDPEFKSLDQVTTSEPVYQEVDPRGDIMEAVTSLEEKFSNFKPSGKKKLAEDATDSKYFSKQEKTSTPTPSDDSIKSNDPVVQKFKTDAWKTDPGAKNDWEAVLHYLGKQTSQVAQAQAMQKQQQADYNKRLADISTQLNKGDISGKEAAKLTAKAAKDISGEKDAGKKDAKKDSKKEQPQAKPAATEPKPAQAEKPADPVPAEKPAEPAQQAPAQPNVVYVQGPKGDPGEPGRVVKDKPKTTKPKQVEPKAQDKGQETKTARDVFEADGMPGPGLQIAHPGTNPNYDKTAMPTEPDSFSEELRAVIRNYLENDMIKPAVSLNYPNGQLTLTRDSLIRLAEVLKELPPGKKEEFFQTTLVDRNAMSNYMRNIANTDSVRYYYTVPLDMTYKAKDMQLSPGKTPNKWYSVGLRSPSAEKLFGAGERWVKPGSRTTAESKEFTGKNKMKKPTTIAEAVKQIEEKYMGFKAVEKAAAKGGAENPAAVAASIGRKKYGKKAFQKAAAAGKKMGESIETVYEEEDAIYIGAQPKKKVPVTKKDEYDGEANMAKGQLKTASDAAKELEHILHSDENIPEWIQAKITLAKEFLETSKDVLKTRHDRGEDYVGEAAKPDFLDLDKDGDRKEPMKKAAKDAKKKTVEEGKKLKDKKQFDDIAEKGDYYITSKGNKVIKTATGVKHEKVHAGDDDKEDLDESGLQYYTGKKKYGKEGMTALAQAGRKGASEEELGRIKDKYKKEDVELNEKAVSKQQQKFMGMVHAVQKGKMKAPSKEIAKTAKGMTKKAAHDFAATKHKGLPTKVKEGLNESVRNHPIYTDKDAWDHYKRELDEQETMEGVRNIQQELDEIALLAGVPVACPTCSSAPCKCEESLSSMAPADSDSPLTHCNTCNESPCSCVHEETIMDEGMSRRDFEAAALEISMLPKEEAIPAAKLFCKIAKKSNPRFDDERFYRACGLSLEECGAMSAPAAIVVGEEEMDEGTCPACDCSPCKCDESMMEEEQEVDEGNPLTKGLADKSIPVGGKIKVGDKEITKTKQIESTDLEPVKEDININISANGEQDALNLIRKLSGMSEVHAEPIIAVGEEEEELDEEHSNHNVMNRMTRDVENLNTPREDYAAADITTMTGTGYDKKKTEIEFAPPPGDNPLQAKRDKGEVKEASLWQQYENMLNEITK